MKHITSAHPECIPAEGKSLLDVGFTLETGGDVAPDILELPAGDDILNDLEMLAGDDARDIANQFLADVARNAPGNESPKLDRQVPIATAQTARGRMGRRF